MRGVQRIFRRKADSSVCLAEGENDGEGLIDFLSPLSHSLMIWSSQSTGDFNSLRGLNGEKTLFSNTATPTKVICFRLKILNFKGTTVTPFVNTIEETVFFWLRTRNGEAKKGDSCRINLLHNGGDVSAVGSQGVTINIFYLREVVEKQTNETDKGGVNMEGIFIGFSIVV